MANTKLSALTAVTTLATNDLFYVVPNSSGTSSSITYANMASQMAALAQTLTNKTITAPTISGITLSAGTASIDPITFTAGTNLTAAVAGSMEYDGTVFYTSHVASARGVSPSMQYSIAPAGDFALAVAAGVQAAFPTTGDVFTFNASTTYLFEGQYYITKSTNSVTTAMAFAVGGGGAVTSILYHVIGQNAAADTTGTTTQITYVDTVSSTVVNAATANNEYHYFKGIIRTATAGTITPQISFSATAAGSPTMKANSYITFIPLGTSTNNVVGNIG
jgi:hypothetical protein